MPTKIIRKHFDSDTGGDVIACECDRIGDDGVSQGRFRAVIRAALVPKSVSFSGLDAWLTGHIDSKTDGDTSATGEITGKFLKAIDIENQITEAAAALERDKADGAKELEALRARTEEAREGLESATREHNEKLAAMDAQIAAKAAP